MQTYYSFTNFFNNVCLAHPNITTFTMGDLYNVDMAKQTLFPLAHLIVNNTSIDLGVMTYNISLLVMDRVVDITDNSYGHYNYLVKNYKDVNNLIDVHNTSLSTINDIASYIYRNPDAYSYTITGASLATPFEERFDNLLAGFAIDMNISVGNVNPMCAISLSDTKANGGDDVC
jgi:hypothetical protein